MRTKIRQQLLSLAFFLLATVAGAQTLKGKVTDDQKEPLLGVTILVKDSPSRGATTNEKGEFTLRVSPEETLVFSWALVQEDAPRLTALYRWMSSM